MKEPLSIVYDMTKLCPWSCPICCMGATSEREACQDELPLAHKLALMEEIQDLECPVKLDFSGGEILTNPENLTVIERPPRCSEVSGSASALPAGTLTATPRLAYPPAVRSAK